MEVSIKNISDALIIRRKIQIVGDEIRDYKKRWYNFIWKPKSARLSTIKDKLFSLIEVTNATPGEDKYNLLGTLNGLVTRLGLHRVKIVRKVVAAYSTYLRGELIQTLEKQPTNRVYQQYVDLLAGSRAGLENLKPVRAEWWEHATVQDKIDVLKLASTNNEHSLFKKLVNKKKIIHMLIGAWLAQKDDSLQTLVDQLPNKKAWLTHRISSYTSGQDPEKVAILLENGATFKMHPRDIPPTGIARVLHERDLMTPSIAVDILDHYTDNASYPDLNKESADVISSYLPEHYNVNEFLGTSHRRINGSKYTLLHLAISLGSVKLASVLIAKDANKNALDKQGKTPLDLLNESGHSPEITKKLKNLLTEAKKS